MTLAELDRRLARIEELLTAAGLPSMPLQKRRRGIRQALTLQAKV